METLTDILKKRFEQNTKLHEGILWEDIAPKLSAEVLESLSYMEGSGGEPDLIILNGRYCYADCCPESPAGRRSLCYDEAALNSRKMNKPSSSAIQEAEKRGLTILNEDEYKYLQSLKDIDLKSSSWLLTPPEIRSRGGAIFGDKKYGRTFIYHNGAESYYSSRAFRAKLLL